MSISKKIVKLLYKKRLNLALAESCTGGLLSSSITSISGSSKVFTMGLITYSNQAKTNILKVPKILLKKHGAVSPQCCLSMVENLSKISKSKICVSITGIAGPSGGTQFKPVGLVYIGIKKHKEVKISKFLFNFKSRSRIQEAAVRKSLDLIIKNI
jgi:nicotinamide-nucleotide amidase